MSMLFLMLLRTVCIKPKLNVISCVYVRIELSFFMAASPGAVCQPGGRGGLGGHFAIFSSDCLLENIGMHVCLGVLGAEQRSL